MATAVNLESKSLVLTLTVRKIIVIISTDKWCKFNVYLMWSQLIIQTEVKEQESHRERSQIW